MTTTRVRLHRKISREELADIIREANGDDILEVTFIKRSTGEKRKMICQKEGPPGSLHGGKLPYDARERQVITVWDTEKLGYRQISIEGIIYAKIDGIFYYIGSRAL